MATSVTGSRASPQLGMAPSVDGTENLAIQIAGKTLATSPSPNALAVRAGHPPDPHTIQYVRNVPWQTMMEVMTSRLSGRGVGRLESWSTPCKPSIGSGVVTGGKVITARMSGTSCHNQNAQGSRSRVCGSGGEDCDKRDSFRVTRFIMCLCVP